MLPLSDRIGGFLGVGLIEIRDLGGQHGYRHVTATLADGRRVFAKVAPGPGDAVAEALAAEANGLRWLAGADGGPRLPEVIGAAAEFLVIELLEPLDRASPQAARRLGADLARMHATGSPTFGAPWPGYIASLPLDNTAPGGAGEGRLGKLVRGAPPASLPEAGARQRHPVPRRGQPGGVGRPAGSPTWPGRRSRRVASTVTCGRATSFGQAGAAA